METIFVILIVVGLVVAGAFLKSYLVRSGTQAKFDTAVNTVETVIQDVKKDVTTK